MSGFSAEWLALREPYDLAARNATVLDAVATAFTEQASISVVDLACGTGATLRAIGPHLPPRQTWRLVDNDLSLLAKASALGRPPHVTVIAKPVDLVARSRARARRPARSRDHLGAARPRVGANGSIASWSRRRRGGCRSMPRSAMTAGPSSSRPACSTASSWPASTPISAPTRASVRRSGRPRRRAPSSGSSMSAIRSSKGRSDWIFGPDDRAMQDALFAGWAEVAALTTRLSSDEIDGWLAQRRADLAAGRSHLRVGHVDIFARPIGTR